MAREKTLEKRLKAKVEKLGGLAVKFYSAAFTGMPDRLVLLPKGRIFFVEMKSTGDDQTPRQRFVSRQLIKLGFQVFKIDSEEQLTYFFKHVDDDL
jgi:hypothetical protein